ncbi:YciI family protein [Microbacterium jejuense]|uniref:YciI family protein n=1 Tax=Microbacterium jejuense TaxID=1263637 RepID=UPI0031E895DD
MRYALLLHYPEMTADDIGPEAIAEGMREFDEYAKALQDAGVLVSADVLQPSAVTTTVTVADGALRVQDGPFADTKEQLGGSFVIEVDDLDAAIAWAGRAPSATWGPVEVRPSSTHFRDGAWTAFAG